MSIAITRYAIRSGWISNTWGLDGGYATFDAVSIDEWRGVPGSEASSAENVRWLMQQRHPDAIEVSNQDGMWTKVVPEAVPS